MQLYKLGTNNDGWKGISLTTHKSTKLHMYKNKYYVCMSLSHFRKQVKSKRDAAYGENSLIMKPVSKPEWSLRKYFLCFFYEEPSERSTTNFPDTSAAYTLTHDQLTIQQQQHQHSCPFLIQAKL